MIRAAAKNHADVAVLVEPEDYASLVAELDAHDGATTLELRRRLAAKAYARTAAYDAAISNWFALELSDPAPTFRAVGGRLLEMLRYGENPHQTAAFYRIVGVPLDSPTRVSRRRTSSQRSASRGTPPPCATFQHRRRTLSTGNTA